MSTKSHGMVTRSSNQEDMEFFEQSNAPILPPKTTNANRSASVNSVSCNKSDTQQDIATQSAQSENMVSQSETSTKQEMAQMKLMLEQMST